MGSRIEMVGKRFNRLTVIKENGRSKQKCIRWECYCDCGNILIIDGNSLRNGNTKSCGCLNIEKIKERSTTHGMSKTPTYSSWKAMIKRCNNTNGSNYGYYGGRGITVCKRWLKFENFFEDMGEKPIGLTIDRFDNNKGYYLKNCGWVSRAIQSKNKRIYKNNKTGTSGVTWSKQDQQYKVRINIDYKRHHLGLFTTIAEAKSAREKAEQTHWSR